MINFQRKKWKLKKNRLHESTKRVVNPCMGFYHIFQFSLHLDYDLDSTDYLDTKDESLLLLEFSLQRYKDEPLPTEALERLKRTLAYFSARPKDLILRFAYDYEGRAYEREPILKQILEIHIRQCLDLVKPFLSHVFLIQGFFIGNWGEMHGSRYLTETQLIRLHEVIREAIGDEVWIAVRRPSFLRILAYETNDKRLCLYNDAILSSETDMGTYGQNGFSEDGRDRNEELRYQAKHCHRLPCGGEVVSIRNKIDAFLEEPDEIISTIQKMHLCYLNRDYDDVVYRRWSNMIYAEHDAFKGQDLFSVISAKLGYRFVIRDVSLFDDQNLIISIENTGFANHLFEMEGSLQIGGVKTSFQIKRRGLLIDKETPIRISLPDMPAGQYEAVLSLRRASDARPIHFAALGFESKDEIVLGTLVHK